MKINYEKLKKSNSVKFNGAFKKGKIKQQLKKKSILESDSGHPFVKLK